jgi:hypothetical protein
LPGGEKLELPHAVAGGYAVVLLFRGSWCPFSNAQLRAFSLPCPSPLRCGQERCRACSTARLRPTSRSTSWTPMLADLAGMYSTIAPLRLRRLLLQVASVPIVGAGVALGVCR